METSLTIRPATLQDFEGVYQMICWLENCEFERNQFLKIYQNMLEQPDRYAMFVALNQDQLISFIDLRLEQLLHHNAKVAEILEFIVDPQCRQNGYGKQIFAYAKQYAKDQGCVQIELSSNVVRLRAHQFYERQGMRKDHFNFTLPL